MNVCESCGKDTVTQASAVASSRLGTLGEASCAWLTRTYQLGRVPTNLCAVCFLPAYGGALEVRWMAQQAPT